MTEPSSDPDLSFDFSDLPETATSRAVAGLGRWAQRQSRETKAFRGLVRALLVAVLSGSGAVVVAVLGAVWSESAARAESRAEAAALREDITDLRDALERVEERQWSGHATHTSGHATEEP